MDPQALTAAYYRGSLLRHCEERMPGVAPAAELMRQWLREVGHGDAEPVTAKGLLASWRRLR